MVLKDLEKQWRRGQFPTLQAALELIFWTLLTKELDKVGNLQQKNMTNNGSLKSSRRLKNFESGL